MVRFRTRSRVSETVKVGPFRFKLKKPLGRGRMWGSAGTRPWRRGRASFSAPLGGARRRNGRRRHWR
jgi:hypothetical protein